MPNIKSAEKRMRVTARRTLENKRIKSRVKTAIRNFEIALASQNPEEAGEKLNKAKSMIDRAVSKDVWHKNTAARKKSRLTKRFKNIAG